MKNIHKIHRQKRYTKRDTLAVHIKEICSIYYPDGQCKKIHAGLNLEGIKQASHLIKTEFDTHDKRLMPLTLKCLFIALIGYKMLEILLESKYGGNRQEIWRHQFL